MKGRVGPSFSIAPLLQFSDLTIEDEIEQNIKKTLEKGSADDDPNDFDVKKPQLVAFGALERIIFTKVRPVPRELLYIEKPDYIESGTVPYLDWGTGLSPSFRDKSYPILAVAWGKVLQLVIYQNYSYVREKSSEQPLLQFDGYYICEHSIDACFFLSESIVFIIANKKEVRILYT